MRVVYFLILSLVSVAVQGQDLVEELTKINKAYTTLTSYEVRLSQLLYDDIFSDSPISNDVIDIKIDGDRSFYKSKDAIMYENASYKAMVSEKSKTVMISMPDDKEAEVSQYDPMNGLGKKLESYTNTCEVKEVRSIDKKTSQIKMGGCSSGYNDIRVYYDVKTYLIQKMEFLTVPDENGKRYKQVLIYQNLNRNASFGARDFFADKYFTTNKDGVKLAPQYIDFELLDLRSY